MEVTKSSKPLTQRVAGGDPAMREARVSAASGRLNRSLSPRVVEAYRLRGEAVGGRPPRRRSTSSLHARGVGRQGCMAMPGVVMLQAQGASAPGKKNASPTPIYQPPLKMLISDSAPFGETPPTPTNAFRRSIPAC